MNNNKKNDEIYKTLKKQSDIMIFFGIISIAITLYVESKGLQINRFLFLAIGYFLGQSTPSPYWAKKLLNEEDERDSSSNH